MDGARLMVTTYYALQDQRIQMSNRIGALAREGVSSEEEIQYLHNFMDEKLRKAENEIKREMQRFVDTVPIYQGFLTDVMGIGPIIAAGLISIIGGKSPNYGVGIARFDTVSKLWAYAGQHVIKVNEKGHRWFPTEGHAYEFHKKHVMWYAEKATSKIDVEKEIKKRMQSACWGDVETSNQIAKKRAGQVANWNQDLKTLCWKIGESFVKVGGYYRAEYDTQKEREQLKAPEEKKIVHHKRAQRKAVKLFLSHLWQKWRELEGLPVRPAYVHEYLGHTTVKNFVGGR